MKESASGFQLIPPLLLLLFDLPQNPLVHAPNPCELKGCPAHKPGHINLHVLAHSHNDAGWLETADQIYRNYVEIIYNNTIQALSENAHRRYVSAENVFFSRWWQGQPSAVRNRVKGLVETGRLQFVGGGWTQNDEAVTHYTAIIDQMTLGLRFLNDTFGSECGVPSVAWQADPFGHTAAQAELFTKMGFDSLMLGRLSNLTKEKWQKDGTLEFVWETGGHAGNILAWVPEEFYSTPPKTGFHDHGCIPAKLATRWRQMPPSVDLVPSIGRFPDFLNDSISFMVDYTQKKAKAHASDVVSLMAGGDLCYVRAESRFRRQEWLAAWISRTSAKKRNSRPIHVVHSTPACYIEALRAASKSWPRFSGDLMPYQDPPVRSWTGFYTTRPSLKMMTRYANGFLQACKQLSVLGKETKSIDGIKKLGEAVATMQHHDAITGTCIENVAVDYARMLYDGIQQCEPVIGASLASLLKEDAPDAESTASNLAFCHLLNQSDCSYTQGKRQFTVVVYNPASVPTSPYVRLPLTGKRAPSMTVTGPGGHQIESQVVQQAPHRHGIPESSGNATWSLVFQAEVAPLGASLYRVNAGPTAARLVSDFLELEESVNFIENERYRLELNPETGLVSNVVLHEGRVSVALRQTFAAYWNEHVVEGSVPGPYVFSGHSEPKEMGEQVTHRVIKGHLVQEIHQIFNDFASQVITLYNDSPFIEFTWTVGPLTKLSTLSSDFISQFESNLESEGFYTDSNGWKDVRRTLTFHEETLPIPSNYYPVTSWIYIKDKVKDLQLVVLPDRPQGGSSRRKGQLELMLHRWHVSDDGLGNSEGIQELGVDGQGLVVRGTHRLFLGSSSEAQKLLRPTALQLIYRPLLVFAPARWKPKRERFSGLRSRLPNTVHILTLERLSDTQVLLRLEHLALTNTFVTVDVTRLISGYRLEDVRPVTLAANQFLPGRIRHSWNSQKAASEVVMASPEMNSLPHGRGTAVNLAPNEIATFVANLISEREL